MVRTGAREPEKVQGTGQAPKSQGPAAERFFADLRAHIPRATGRELAAIEAELRCHLEDAAEALGRTLPDPAQAEEQALRALGDPAAIGAALNAQFSPFWLWLARLARLVCAVAALGLLYALLDRFCAPFHLWALKWM